LYSLLLAAERAGRATGAPAGAERGSWGPASEGERESAGAKPPGSKMERISLTPEPERQGGEQTKSQKVIRTPRRAMRGFMISSTLPKVEAETSY
jgi:hypothetical protein